MLFFFKRYQVEHRDHPSSDWKPVLTSVSLKHAKRFIHNKTTGLFHDSHYHYRIIKK